MNLFRKCLDYIRLETNKSHIEPHEMGGFTLAELLIALAILGVIATFTIPKVLNSSQNGEFIATTKEAIAALSQAQSAYQLNNSVSSTADFMDYTPYLNYVSIDTVTQARKVGGTTDDCSLNVRECLVLHNGGILWSSKTRTYGGSTPLHANYYYFNPSPHDGTTEALRFFIYLNGRVTSDELVAAGTTTSAGVHVPSTDPTWFSWD